MTRSLCLIGLLILLALGGCGEKYAPPPAMAPSPPSATAKPISLPVYNADISPQLPRHEQTPNRPVLRSGEVTTLRFGIGAPWSSSAIPPVTPNEKILRSLQDVHLMVLLACSICEAHHPFQQDMVFKRDAGESNVVSFSFVPKRLAKDEVSRIEGNLKLTVVNLETGEEYDRFTIDVAVETALDSATAAPTEPLAFEHSYRPTDSPFPPDVVLFAHDDTGNGVMISVVPVNLELKQSLANLVFDENGLLRRFKTGLRDKRDLEKYTTPAYVGVSQISLQGDFAELMRRSGGAALVSKDAQKTGLLSEDEARKVTDAIAKISRTLYRKLFMEGDDRLALSNIIHQIEAAPNNEKDNRPLRLFIVTDLSMPWQYLHPSDSVINPDKFWGLRFSLTVQRYNATNRTLLAPSQQINNGWKVVFARYAGTSDETVTYANQQIDQLTKLLSSRPLVVDSSRKFLEDALTTERNNISAIIAFLHASSTKAPITVGNVPAFGDQGVGPLLYFAEKDAINTVELEELLNGRQVTESDSRYLGGAPLVILNACETGPSTIAIPYVTLQDAMFDLGAEGIVVTEVSVWVPLGHEVATRLIAKLDKGQTVGDALTAVRRELYADKKNPLGLLYAYYGNPSATLRH